MKRKFLYHLLTGMIPILIGFQIEGCGSSSSSSTQTSITDAMSSDLVIASPTASVTASSSKSPLFRTSMVSAAASVDSDATYEEKKEALDAIINGTSLTDCAFTLSLSANFAQRALCYGPSVNYLNFPNSSGSDGNLPSGDLGLWNETSITAGQTSMACAADQ
jgi:hypothetical protein